MVKQKLSTHLYQYYEKQQPAPEKLTHWLEMSEMASTLTSEEEHTQKSQPRDFMHSARGFRFNLGLSVALAAVLTLFFFWPTANVTQGVSKEIVLNHNKSLALEFLSESYDNLGKVMPKLGFNLLSSKQMPGQGLRMMGGRYCSIQGEIAAQIRFQDEAGQIYTLYQTPLTDDLLKLETGSHQREGLNLKLWREDGLFFGLVGPTDQKTAS